MLTGSTVTANTGSVFISFGSGIANFGTATLTDGRPFPETQEGFEGGGISTMNILSRTAPRC